MPPAIANSSIDRLQVMASFGGRLKPIPFQVDEVLPDGRYALPRGPEPLADDSPGIYDKDDELVLMVSDLGDRLNDLTELPEYSAEIEVIDPIDNQARYAYVAKVESPRRNPTDYVDYDPRTSRIESEHYRLTFTQELPNDFSLQSHKKEGLPNLIDRLKLRITAKILLGLSTFHLSEGDVRNQLVAYNDGPIRVIRRLRHSISIGFGIRSPSANSDAFFYRDYIDNPIEVNLPWVPSVIFGGITVRTYLDFINLGGYSLAWSGMTGPPVPIGPRLPGPAPAPTTQIDWLAMRGENKTMVQTLVMPPEMASVQRRLFFWNSSTPDPPERLPGNHPGIGYMMTRWESLSSGRHRFDSILLEASDKNFDPDRLMHELTTPLAITVRAVEQ